MKSLKEKKTEIINFWDIEEEADREQLIEALRNYAEIKRQAELVPEIREHFEQINESYV